VLRAVGLRTCERERKVGVAKGPAVTRKPLGTLC
jgi:hypothetical protein